MEIWLETSIHSHGFIREAFWRSKQSDMFDTYIPGAENWVYELEGRIVGFYSLVGETLAALFVLPAHHGQEIGSLLLGHAKNRRKRLELAVYAENHRACAFYEHRGFAIVDKRQDEAAGHMEYVMEYRCAENNR